MKNQWIEACLDFSAAEGDFYSGCRKIFRNRSVKFRALKNDLQLVDAGYAKQKLTMLIKNYVHVESRDVAIELWNKRLGQRKYGSVSFTCFSHFVKGGSIDAKRSKRASIFGPCIQSVSLTYLEREHKCAVDIFYRTTELFKKFPADLVFIRDVLLADFNFRDCPIKEINFHFANITCHPMYFVTIIPLLDDPISELEEIKLVDKYFWTWCIKWTARYLLPEHHRGIAKFSQAMRVHADANNRIKEPIKSKLVSYLRKNHPGFKKGYVDPDATDD